MRKKKNVAVIIPLYKNELSVTEEISLRQCVEILANYDKVIVKPMNLDISHILSSYPSLLVENFGDECFKSIRSYNKFVLSTDFYQRFIDYSFVLIYQLDAFVFKDELQMWIDKGYDYIGAPWLPHDSRYEGKWGNFILSVKRNYYRLLQSPKMWKYCYYEIGNGGFSLRKVDKMLELIQCYELKINRLLDGHRRYHLNQDDLFYPEDLFLHFEITNKKCRLNVPPLKEGLLFSLELYPDWGYKHNNNVLPFGCHAWEKLPAYLFWKDYIKM